MQQRSNTEVVIHTYRFTAILGPGFLLCMGGGAFLPPSGGGGGTFVFTSLVVVVSTSFSSYGISPFMMYLFLMGS